MNTADMLRDAGPWLAAGGASVTLLALPVLIAAGNRQMRGVLAAYDAETARLAAAELPPPPYSESVGFDPADVLDTIRRHVAEEIGHERMTDTSGVPLFAELLTPPPLPELAAKAA